MSCWLRGFVRRVLLLLQPKLYGWFLALTWASRAGRGHGGGVALLGESGATATQLCLTAIEARQFCEPGLFPAPKLAFWYRKPIMSTQECRGTSLIRNIPPPRATVGP